VRFQAGWYDLVDAYGLNQPPLNHTLIAGAYRLGGETTWMARLPGAFLTATSVPLLYLLGREIFPARRTALLGAGGYGLLLPVVRHGRLAMLDGTVVCFFIALLWMMMKARRQPAWYWGVGLCFALMCLTKGILGLLLLTIALLFLAWDAPQQLRSPQLWGALLLASLPVLGWYWLQWQYYGQKFIDVTLLNQNFGRIWVNTDNHQGPPWYYLQELLEYSWPWLIFWPLGLGLTWRMRSQSWAKLVLVWTGVYLLAISIMGTKLPWYIFPVYPAIGLTVGVALSAAWHRGAPGSNPGLSLKVLPRYWAVGLTLLSVVCGVGVVYASPWGGEPSLALVLVFVVMMVATGVAAVWVKRQNRQFILVLMAGVYLALLGLVTSDHWLWELGESYPVLPVAQMINENVPRHWPIFIADIYERPSLDFYVDRRVRSRTTETLLEAWQRPTPVYLLVSDPDPFKAGGGTVTELGTASGLHLIVVD